MSTNIDHSKAPTFVIRHRVAAEHRDAYEQWTKKIGRDAVAFDGHLGAEIIRPSDNAQSGEYTVVIRFDSEEHLLAWAQSNTRAQYVKEVEPLLLDGDKVEIHRGIDFWFTQEGSSPKHATPWKQFCVTLSALLPLTTLVHWTLGPLFTMLPDDTMNWAREVIGKSVVVGLMVWVVMPRYTRLLSRWLYS